MADNHTTRRSFLKLAGWLGVTWVATQLLTNPKSPGSPSQSNSPIARLLPDYFASTRSNIVTHLQQRAILSSALYPKATFIRDAFYGPLALNDLNLSTECYRWFAVTQLPTGQIRTAVPFTSADEPEFPPGDDDSTLLFIIWSAWLWRNRITIDAGPIRRAIDFVRTHVIDEYYVTPAGAFRYWADTVKFEQVERIAHNQGLYVLALQALRQLDMGDVTDAQLAQAKANYASFFRSELGAMALGKDTWWANTIDLSALFPEFLLRWLYTDAALPDQTILATVDHFRKVAAVTRPDNTPAGIKIICAGNGDYLDRQRFFAPGLNWPGEYQNGGYWPMYTLTAFALAYRLTREPALQRTVEQLITLELNTDHRSKEVINLVAATAETDKLDRSNYTWNALIVPAIKWAGIA